MQHPSQEVDGGKDQGLGGYVGGVGFLQGSPGL